MLFSAWSAFLSQDPSLRLLQLLLLTGGATLIFLLFYATRDILLRTESFWYQAFCIALVAGLPFVGFLCYLLIRPARTVKQREIEALMHKILDQRQVKDQSRPKHHHKQNAPKQQTPQPTLIASAQ